MPKYMARLERVLARTQAAAAAETNNEGRKADATPLLDITTLSRLQPCHCPRFLSSHFTTKIANIRGEEA